ncbi:hypothetical protein [Rhizobium hidalgonense]|uniref:hypothetical protein n=1 Tax=Rhizobium hidalgonense TaxID=1538159 RepID=UPI002871BDC1|nr:hypothetical protein [Rhizobium hidalgonense]MDR9804164.1 hypothetical protein [Rhizobium hidalgonense]
MAGLHRRSYITASRTQFAIDCESVRQGRRYEPIVGAAVLDAVPALFLSNVTVVKRRVLMGIVDKGALIVSSRDFHRCRELSAIPVLFGRLARPFLSADSQPLGNQRIQKE